MEINDNLFQQFISCPLKLYHSGNSKSATYRDLPFKHRNKLLLRDTVSLQFQNRKFTSDNTDQAFIETVKWIKDDKVAICGAVFKSGNFITRIPILLKDGNRFTIIQIHGKLRKRSQAETISTVTKSRTTALYLLKAAYRTEIIRHSFPDAVFDAHFYFPERGFRATSDLLLQKAKTVRDSEPDPELVENCKRLFAKVTATGGVEEVSASIPESIASRSVSGKSLAEVLELINRRKWNSGNPLNIKIHQGCKSCVFRKSDTPGKAGCWDEFFVERDMIHPDRHVFELIGHGNEADSDKGFHYQEEVPYSDQFTSFEIIKKYGGPVITIQQRRILQLLKSKGDPVPELWVKPMLKELAHLNFPLHFIDFEAATYALPMQRGVGPYTPVYFQFSCHTLYESGELKHHEWLDDNMNRAHPHLDFIGALTGIPAINSGTVIQYSPFESQGVRLLLAEMKRNSMLYKRQVDKLIKFIEGDKGGVNRFYDLSRLVRDAYYNSAMEGSLGLKQVLRSILNWSQKNTAGSENRAVIHDMEVDLFRNADDSDLTGPDPYKSVQGEGMTIDDGEIAMNVYVSLKSGLLTDSEQAEMPVKLKRYCALDSYSLIIIYKHLKMLMEQIVGDNDVVFL
jgi:hypothetical protein